MKPTFKIIALVFIVALLFLYNLNVGKTPPVVNAQFELSTNISNDVHRKKNTLNGFNFKIKTILSTNNKISNQSSFEGKFLLKPEEVNNQYLGQIKDVKIVSQVGEESNTINISKSIPFKVKYNNFVFDQVNLLKLTADHPVNAIKVLLKQLSYQFDKPLKITSATNETEYRYKRNGNSITRTAVYRDYFNSDLNLQRINQNENWEMLLDKENNIIKLNFTNQNLFKNDINELNLTQEIEVTVINSKTEFKKLSYELDANSSISAIHLMQPKKHEILNENQLLNAIAQLKHNMQNESLLSEVGRYLGENYDTDKLLALLNGSPNASALIYALQKSNTQKSEISLINLLEHPDLQAQNQQRVIMSLARLINASDYAFTSLKAVADNKEHQYSNTALLNIGSVAKNSPDLAAEVEHYLSDQLTNSNKTAMTLLAINNSGSNKLNAHVSNLLGNKNAEVNIVALKILAKDIKYQDRLIDYASTSSNPKEIIAVAQGLRRENRSLSASQKKIIEAKLAETEHPILKTQLSELLVISNKTF